MQLDSGLAGLLHRRWGLWWWTLCGFHCRDWRGWRERQSEGTLLILKNDYAWERNGNDIPVRGMICIKTQMTDCPGELEEVALARSEAVQLMSNLRAIVEPPVPTFRFVDTSRIRLGPSA